MLAEELAERLSMPVEHAPHLEAGVRGACGNVGALNGTWDGIGVGHTGRDIFLARVGEDEAFLYVQVAAVVADADQYRVVRLLRDLRPREAVFAEQEL